MYNNNSFKPYRNVRITTEYSVEKETTSIYVDRCISEEELKGYPYFKLDRKIGNKCLISCAMGFKKETMNHLLITLILIKDLDKLNEFRKLLKDLESTSYTIQLKIE